MSKQLLSVMLCFAILVLMLVTPTKVCASSDGLEITPDSEERRESFTERHSLVILEEEPAVNPIRCFDVRQDGCVVLGFYGSEKKTICVYSPEQKFMYGYSFSCTGDFYVFWEDEYLCIFLVRSDVIAKLDRDGNCVELGLPVATDAFFDIRDRFMSSSKQVNGVSYRLENDIIVGSDFGRLVMTSPDGSESVFYDATALHNGRVILRSACIILFAALVGWGLIRQEKKRKRSKTECDGKT